MERILLEEIVLQKWSVLAMSWILMKLNEEEQGGKRRKTLNFTRADWDASSSSSIGDVAGPETAKDKCTGYWKISSEKF